MVETDTRYDAREHVIRIQGGAEYLAVKDRIVWFRKENPLGTIETEMLRLDEKVAVFKASVRVIDELHQLVSGATGHGSETPGDFRDYIEKAETKAIGRALAALGYGTQAAFEESPDRPADSPVVRDAAQNANGGAVRRESGGVVAGSTKVRAAGPGLASEKQVGYLRGLVRQRFPDKAEGDDSWVEQQIGHPIDELTKQEASALIDRLSKPKAASPAYVGVDMAAGEVTAGRADPVQAQQGVLHGVPEPPSWIDDDPRYT